jgi:GT2 family glycosyltransferase
MNRNSVGGLASIIVPCWNQLEFSRQCIAALVRHTRPPWELIIIDNGSTDGTGAYLSGVQDAAAVPVTVIANTTNRGFPTAMNQGLQQARGEYLVLLNNDVVVTDARLEQLIALTTAKTGEQNGLTAKDANNAKEEKEANGTDKFADETLIRIGQRPNVTVIDFENVSSAADRSLTSPLVRELRERSVESRENSSQLLSCSNFNCLVSEANGPFTRGGKLGVGLCGPMSNYAAPPQLVENVPYCEIEAMHDFARTWRDQHRGQWFTVPKLSGFCLLMKRAVYETIGGLDERFGLGFFDDDDLAERARRAGFELAIAHDFVRSPLRQPHLCRQWSQCGKAAG